MDSPRWIHDALPIFLKPHLLILSLVRLSLDLGILPGDFHILYSFFYSIPSHANLICDICETYFKASLSCNLEVFWAIFYPLGFAQSLAKAAASSWQKSFELIKFSGKIQSKIYLIWQSWSNISKKTQNIWCNTALRLHVFQDLVNSIEQKIYIQGPRQMRKSVVMMMIRSEFARMTKAQASTTSISSSKEFWHFESFTLGRARRIFFWKLSFELLIYKLIIKGPKNLST